MEIDFKHWFRSRCRWSEAIEPGLGSGVGIPDLLMISARNKLFPVELKEGVWKGDRLFTTKVRAAQINWHKRFKDAGGISYVVVGVKDADVIWVAYVVKDLTDWKSGWGRDQLQSWKF
jgi:hypothetical protein